MTDKAKILAEIERFRESNKVSEDKEYAQYELDVKCGYDMALDDMLSFINSLPEEPVSIPKDELQTWLKKQFKVSEKVMVRAERDWDRAYNNGEMTAYNNVINKVDSYDRQRIIR